MPPLAGLKRRAEFLAAARARSAAMPSLTLQARRRDPAEFDPAVARVGVTCSRKVGNAVARNRAKRRLRAAAREVLPGSGHAGWDYVLIGRPTATAERPYPLLLDDLRIAVGRVHAPRRARAPAR